MPDFTTYQPPGVYVEEDLTSLVNVIGVRPTVVAIVGPAVGYRRHTESALLAQSTPITLSQPGANPASVVVTAADGTVYDLTDDYTVSSTAGEDGDILSTTDNRVLVTRVDIGEIADGGLIYLSYQYTNSEYHAPLRVSDFDDVKDAYGPPVDMETGAIISPLSFAAKIAMENGARRLILVPTTGTSTTTREELTVAYAKLSAMIDVNVIVPLPVGITGTQVAPGDTVNLGTDLKSFVETSANDGIFRVGILGLENTASVDPEESIANYRSSRIVQVWPNRLFYYHGYRNLSVEVSGYYLAASYAGRMASLPVQTPLTKKEINGFSGFPAAMASTMTASQKNSWSDSGIAVTEVNRNGRMVVRHGTTTNRSNIQTRELSLVRAKDSLVNLLYETMDSSGIIGGYIEADTPSIILGVVEGVLESAKNSDLIVDYNSLKIRQLLGDPTVMEIKFQYRPAYPLNYVVISFSIDTTTGTTTVLDVAE